jgi:hypothetical protein
MNSLGEDLLLVAIDPRNGVLRCRSHMHFGLMGAELVMLAAEGRVKVDDDGKLRAVEPSAQPTGDPELDAALGKLAAAGRPPKVRGYVSRPRRNLTNAYLDRLIAAGTVQRHGGAFRPRWPVIDQARAAAVRSQLDAIVLGEGPVSEQQAAYAGLADAIGLPGLIYRGKENREARKRLREITKSHWVAEPVRRASDAADAASAG